MLHLVSLEVPADEAERSLEFWLALGFARVPAPPEIAEYVSWVESGGTQIHLIPTPEPTVPALGHAGGRRLRFRRDDGAGRRGGV